jgi:hypothetical protein
MSERLVHLIYIYVADRLFVLLLYNALTRTAPKAITGWKEATGKC